MKSKLTNFELVLFQFVIGITLWTEFYCRVFHLIPESFNTINLLQSLCILAGGGIVGWMKAERKERPNLGMGLVVSLIILYSYIVSYYEGWIIGGWVFAHFLMMFLVGISVIGLWRGVGRVVEVKGGV